MLTLTRVAGCAILAYVTLGALACATAVQVDGTFGAGKDAALDGGAEAAGDDSKGADAPFDSSGDAIFGLEDTAAGDAAKHDDSGGDASIEDTVAVDTGPVCAGGKTACAGGCVDTSTDASSCGSCGHTCAAAEACVAGACAATTPRCDSGAISVLFYGPIGSGEQPYLPVGATSTIAADATWRAMTTADFAKYQLIVIGEGAYSRGAAWDAALATKAVWSAAVTGRIFVNTLDPVAHIASGRASATTEVKAALAWTAGGPGTNLYVGPDYGARKLDFMAYFGAWTALGQLVDSVSGDDVHILLTSHGSMIGSTDASLSTWGSSYHGAITSMPAGFSVVASATSSPTHDLVVARDAKCSP